MLLPVEKAFAQTSEWLHISDKTNKNLRLAVKNTVLKLYCAHGSLHSAPYLHRFETAISVLVIYFKGFPNDCTPHKCTYV